MTTIESGITQRENGAPPPEVQPASISRPSEEEMTEFYRRHDQFMV